MRKQTREKIKSEPDASRMFREALGASAWVSDQFATDEGSLELHKTRVKEATRRMAADAGLSLPDPSVAESRRSFTSTTNKHGSAHGTTLNSDADRRSDAHGTAPTSDVNRHGGVHGAALLTDQNEYGGARAAAVAVKTPKFSGKADWEAFHAQFELLAHAGGWSEDRKALELAMCLTDDALNCLLLLNPEDRHDYKALVGALRRRFWSI
ncbi:hypothetical protein QQF64_036157 [Cirrhinus molitorella]|uniref:Uncharacterized protein n=1 Tax=Cirrhinus molitorella TaxID=172907 RepID=A0ABR3NHY3_9TELE